MSAALRTSAATTTSNLLDHMDAGAHTRMATLESDEDEDPVKPRFEGPNAVDYINAPNRDHSVERSIRKVFAAFCETCQFFLCNVYNDAGYGNKTLVLPSFWNMCYALPKFKISAVILFGRDHLSPDCIVARRLAEEIQEMGVKIYVISQGALPLEAG